MHKENTALLIDIAILGDVREEAKDVEKVMKYQYLACEVKRLWQLKSVKVIPASLRLQKPA